MSPERTLAAPSLQTGTVWRRACISLALAWIGLVLVFLPDWQAMAGQWWNSSTYNHIVLIPPIIAWLAWQRIEELRKLSPQPSQLGLLALGLALIVWLLGAFSGLSLARQAGAVAMLPSSLLLLLGGRVAAGLAFPLGYMAFLVPFGDELVPPLQTITARLSIALVHLSGIQATINGVFIDTRAGLFVVAEACSGVKFLVAMVAFGVLAANLAFKSWGRRCAFLVVAAVVPVLANGVRAWGTIYVAQFKGAAYAGGFDHIIYGWIFFAIVIALILGLSWRFFDRSPIDPMIDAEALNQSPWLERIARFKLPQSGAWIGLLLAILGAQAWAGAADALSAPMPRQIDLAPVAGWHRVSYAPRLGWQPRAHGADHRLLGSYADGRGNQVDVFVAIYASQGEGKEAGGFGEGALTPDTPWSWASEGPAVPGFKSERLIGDGTIERYAQTLYRTGAVSTGSNTRLKLAVMADRLLLREHPTIMLIISSETRPGRPAPAALAAFRRSAAPLDAWMDRVAQVR